jgi:RNA polymerase sigma-70 factor (ECF subfamily)
MRPLDPDSLGQLYRQHAPALRLFARQWGGIGDDLVHDAFVCLARQNPPPANALAWLYRVVRTGALADRRAAGRRRRRESEVSPPEAWFTPVDESIDAHEAARRLAELPLDVREIIVARLWGGLTFDEVSRLVGCSLATAHRKYQAGLMELRKRLEGRWTPDPTT